MSQSRPLREWIRNLAAPVIALTLAFAAWEIYVRLSQTPPYILPAPSLIFETLWKDRGLLLPAMAVTMTTAFKALGVAAIGACALAILLAQSRWLNRALLPFAIILQVTPVVAIAPLLLVWMDQEAAILTCAFLVAFFPILSNMTLGLSSTERNLTELFALYRANRWQDFWLLRLPFALPYFLTGLRIGGGLALIGAVVGELAAGASGKGAGLAFRIMEAGYRVNIARMFAGLALVCLAGLLIYAALALLSYLALRNWHESARGEN